jgi:hypothetical protein
MGECLVLVSAGERIKTCLVPMLVEAEAARQECRRQLVGRAPVPPGRHTGSAAKPPDWWQHNGTQHCRVWGEP